MPKLFHRLLIFELLVEVEEAFIAQSSGVCPVFVCVWVMTFGLWAFRYWNSRVVGCRGGNRHFEGDSKIFHNISRSQTFKKLIFQKYIQKMIFRTVLRFHQSSKTIWNYKPTSFFLKTIEIEDCFGPTKKYFSNIQHFGAQPFSWAVMPNR